MAGKPRNTVEVFWGRVERGPGCWEWRGSVASHGYGEFWISPVKWTSHRLAYTDTYGPIPEGRVVRHTCDNRKCCRPSHLILGTQAENMADMAKRSRASKGEARPNAKLTAEKVEALRAYVWSGLLPHRELAKHVGVSYSVVGEVIAGKRWRSV